MVVVLLLFGHTEWQEAVLYCIVLYCSRVPAANAPGCTTT